MSDKRRSVGERWTCDCGVALIGARTINNKVAPIEVAPPDEGVAANVWLGRDRAGNPIAATLGGPLVEVAEKHGIVLRRNHWANEACPWVMRRRESA